jgi:ribosomal protein S12 methylthiotransferase
MPTACLVTLGCPKNIVEGEHLAGALAKAGCTLVTTLEDADIAIVHTCAFIADARSESVAVIKTLTDMKKDGRLEKIIVTGCLVQEEGKRIVGLYPGIDAFLGTGQLDRLGDVLRGTAATVIGRPGGLLESPQRFLSSGLPTAYLKIAEGCNHRCGFCIIPRLCGRYHSRRMESITAEARSLTKAGVRELTVIAQDTSAYGYDIYRRYALDELLRKLCRINDLHWLRLMYAYPSTVNDHLIDVLRTEEKICKYIDIPLQHVNRDMLALMRRPANVRATIEKLTFAVPGIALRTAFIVGYPGETDKRFRELCDLVAEGWFDQMGVFAYSDHPSVAAAQLAGKVPVAVRQERQQELMLIQQKVVAKKLRSLKGSTVEVFVESEMRKGKNDRRLGTGKYWSGRTRFQAPEVDGRIYCSGKAAVGSFVNVLVTGCQGYDLLGVIR